MIGLIKKIAAAGLALAALSIPVDAIETERYDIDDAHTSVLFFVKHLGFSEMQGEFNDVSGSLVLDRENFANSTIKAVMKSGSVDMDHGGLNKHLSSADFFNVAKFPTLTFTSTKITKGEGNQATVEGTLEMLGQKGPVILDVTLSGEGINPLSKKKTVAFRALGELDRTKWGMTYFAGPLGTSVKIQIDTELVIVD